MNIKRNYFLYGLAVGFIFLFLPSLFEPWGNFTAWLASYITGIFPWADKDFGWVFIFCGFSIIIWLIVKLIMLIRFGFLVLQNWIMELAFYSLVVAVFLSIFFVMSLIAFSRFQGLWFLSYIVLGSLVFTAELRFL